MKHHSRLLLLVPFALALAATACRETASERTEPAPPAPPASPAAAVVETPAAPAGTPVAAPSRPLQLTGPLGPGGAAPSKPVRLVPQLSLSVPPRQLTTSGALPRPGTGGATAPVAAPGDDPSVAPPGPAVGIQGIDVHPVDVAEAEDGYGSRVPATNPVALDVRADAWPGRALDPVLHVGRLIFRSYEHPAPGVLRYVAADAAALPDGAAVWILYGNDPRGRLEVTSALRVPR